MLIYNITTKVDHAVTEEWLQWQKEIHIPEIMATGCFIEHRFYRLLEHDDEEGKIYITQFIAGNRKDYDAYIAMFSVELRKKASEKWGDKTVSFRTLLENVE